MKKFLDVLILAGATEDNPRVMLGYHGTPSRNAATIMKNGFCPKCRRSSGDGAYFSGELSYSLTYARKDGGIGFGDVFLVALLETNPPGVRTKPGSDLINAQGAIFKEETTLPLARLSGF